MKTNCLWAQYLLNQEIEWKKKIQRKCHEDSSSKVPENYATCHQFMKIAYIYTLES